MDNSVVYVIARCTFLVFLIVLFILDIYDSVQLNKYYKHLSIKQTSVRDTWAAWLAFSFIIHSIGTIGEYNWSSNGDHILWVVQAKRLLPLFNRRHISKSNGNDDFRSWRHRRIHTRTLRIRTRLVHSRSCILNVGHSIRYIVNVRTQWKRLNHYSIKMNLIARQPNYT